MLNEQVSAWRSVGTRYAVQTGKGQILEFDKIIVCWGGEAQSSFLQSEFASSIDPHTMKLSVDPYLRLSDTVFAVGDVTTADYPRTTPALIQGELTLHNIAALIRGKPLQAYKRQRDMGLITLGVTMTIFIVGGWCLMANTLGMDLKAKGEKKFFGEWGQTWGFDVDWAKDISDKAALYASGNKVGSSSREEL
jgi:NADH dehydrogenase FAD-containing subunit